MELSPYTHTHNFRFQEGTFAHFLILGPFSNTFFNFEPGGFDRCCGGNITSSNIIQTHTLQNLRPEVVEPYAEKPGRREGMVAP